MPIHGSRLTYSARDVETNARVGEGIDICGVTFQRRMERDGTICPMGE
jgi:hypothetical protein